MGAQLNIKDEEIVDKVRKLAVADGRPMVATIRALVDQEWCRREDERAKLLARMIAFTEEIHAAMPGDVKGMTSEEIMEAIYDDNEDDGFAR